MQCVCCGPAPAEALDDNIAMESDRHDRHKSVTMATRNTLALLRGCTRPVCVCVDG